SGSRKTAIFGSSSSECRLALGVSWASRRFQGDGTQAFLVLRSDRCMNVGPVMFVRALRSIGMFGTFQIDRTMSHFAGSVGPLPMRCGLFIVLRC
ncbi:hypothetical protein, partial [Sphingobium fuliginis]|uniref:hypothetical protein n=1 Tax=Sphingobium fuliginis (strain ATCC 27551) TaxID=336203 RepID=UPI001C2FCC2A